MPGTFQTLIDSPSSEELTVEGQTGRQRPEDGNHRPVIHNVYSIHGRQHGRGESQGLACGQGRSNADGFREAARCREGCLGKGMEVTV